MVLWYPWGRSLPVRYTRHPDHRGGVAGIFLLGQFGPESGSSEHELGGAEWGNPH